MSGARPREEFVAGTRGSPLALRQTEQVLGLLRARHPEITWVSRVYSTKGDEASESPLPAIGGNGAFTEAIEQSLRAGAIAFAVHSLKDLPLEASSGLVVAAVVGPRISGEALVSRGGVALAELAPGAVVGTSSLRRREQLLFRRPDLRVRSIRGNVETRIAKVDRGDYDAALLAAAGMERLGLAARISEYLTAEVMLPAPGQGAIAVQCRGGDARLLSLLAAAGDEVLAACTLAERTFLAALGGGCSAPVAALATAAAPAAHKRYRLVGRVVSAGRMIEVAGEGEEPEELGRRLAEEALERGAGELLRGGAAAASQAQDAQAAAAAGGAAALASPAGRAAQLAGKRIVVTRPAVQARELADPLEKLGARVIILPVIETRPLPQTSLFDQAAGRLAAYRWIVLASANAAGFFFAALEGRSGAVESLAGRIAVVGEQTAASVSARGIEPAYVARVQSGAGLAAELPEVEGAEVLLPCAERHTEELPALLERRGARVTAAPIYRTESLPIDREGIEELRKGVDFVLFTSGSAVAAFVEGVRDAGGEELVARLLGGAKVACIGPSTAQAVREAGFVPAIVAADHSIEGLVAAVCSSEPEACHE